VRNERRTTRECGGSERPAANGEEKGSERPAANGEEKGSERPAANGEERVPVSGEKIVLALGSNLGDRADILQGGVDAIAAIPEVQVMAVSPVYETVPV
jgi:hypothetical protein